VDANPPTLLKIIKASNYTLAKARSKLNYKTLRGEA
jgi:hypothetical protein